MKNLLIAASSLGLAAAGPIQKRAGGVTDGVILNYALTLEHLENNFYKQGLANFTQAQFASAGFDAATYNRIKTIAADEASHVKFLTDALGAAGVKATAECTYAFGVTSPQTFMATASVLEGVGVSAYLGAAADIMSKTYLTAAGAILTTEARHSAYIRNSIKQNPFASPFDTPLSYNEVYTLAAQFITGCPSSNPALPVKAFPTLMATSTDMAIAASTSTLMLSTPGQMLVVPQGGKVYAAFITVLGPVFVEATQAQGGMWSAKVPAGVAGQTYVVLTSCNTAATDDTIIAGPAIIEVSM